MTSRREKPFVSMRRVSVEALVLGTVASLTLALIQAPIWTFYFIGFLTAPLMILRVPRMDPNQTLPTERLAAWVRRLVRRGRHPRGRSHLDRP
jgi:hypothetical protein